MPFSLYLHIPFCIKRCVYCDFVSGIYAPDKADAYINALKREISNIPNKVVLSTLYIGGGTPTALPTALLSDLISQTFSHFDFIEGYEATIEANPGTLDREKLSTIRSVGINRISLGAQSFDDDELALLGRVHTGKEAEHALDLAREAGFENIGIDLIYGLPGQNIDSWKKTLERAVSLGPEHISTYELTVEKETTLHKYIESQTLHLLDEEKIIEMYEFTIDYLISKGFIHYEISNFALPDYQCRHNLNYWERGEYYGAGTAAHSHIGRKRLHNTMDTDEYLRLISEDRSALRGSEDISEKRALSEAVFLGLRKKDGLIVESLSRRYRINILSHFHKEIKNLQDAGLIEIVGSPSSYETSLRLTRKGLMLSNEVFVYFI